jgi:uncharacterized integral membrane protein
MPSIYVFSVPAHGCELFLHLKAIIVFSLDLSAVREVNFGELCCFYFQNFRCKFLHQLRSHLISVGSGLLLTYIHDYLSNDRLALFPWSTSASSRSVFSIICTHRSFTIVLLFYMCIQGWIREIAFPAATAERSPFIIIFTSSLVFGLVISIAILRATTISRFTVVF